MKSTKKFISILLVVMMLMTCISVSFTVNASTGTLCSYYATNPDGKAGVQKTITIDGDASDWSDDMLIAQGAAWDVANHWKGGHENCVLDTYALYATWDNNNLYVGWQMVNTTDTWAREGDGPLSDGGRVLDVPLILALSVDPTSTSMSNKNTDGNPIWGQKMGLQFDSHVDHLFYMSGKPGLGEPAMFTAVDANGNTNYTTGCHLFKSSGIEYKMAETNICDNIYGLDYSESTDDVYSDDANWVDYKTFKGQSGVHNTKYDSFYEIKIPLSQLGIDASYIQNNGIGAMLVATRGESALDCIPFDDTMLDNATGDYGNDPSTSHEKDDEDVITSDFARIGKSGGVVPPVTTVPVTTAPVTTVPVTTVPVTTEPPVSNLTVNAKSNLFTTNTVALADNAETVTVRYDLQSAMDLVNGQWKVTYDTSKLSLTTSKAAIMPGIADDVINIKDGVIKGNFTNVNDLYDFSTSKPFVELTFDVIGTGKTDVTLDVQELSVGYISNSKLNYKNAVVNSTKVDLSSTTGFTSSSISGTANVIADSVPTTPVETTAPVTTTPVSDDLTLNVTSNFFPAASKTYDASEEEVTVTFMLSSTMDLINTEWALTYDTSKLSFDKSTITGLMPNVTNSVIRESETGTIKGNFTTLSLCDFKDEKAFITVTFDVLDKGTANVDLYVDVLGVAYLDDNFEAVEQYIVDFGKIEDVTTEPGFENEKYTVDTIFSEPTVIPTNPTDPVDNGLTVKATSNILDSVSKIYNESDKTVTISYKLQSTMDIVNGNWILTYDSSVLSYDPAKNSGSKMMPNIPGAIANQPEAGTLKAAFTNLGLYDFKAEKDFVKVTFDVIGSGVTTVDLFVETLGVAYLDENLEVVEAYPVDYGKLVDITNKPGFENQRFSGRIVFDEDASILLGDVNDDGLVNVTDATLVQKHLAKITTFTDDMEVRADVNKDGVVNINDASLIQKYAAQLISSF